MGDVALKAEGLEFTMTCDEQRTAGSLVASSGLDADKAILDEIDTADGVTRTDFVKQFNQGHGFQLHAVHRHGDSAIESDHDLFFQVGRFLRRTGDLPRGR